jgi:hypothetical protein
MPLQLLQRPDLAVSSNGCMHPGHHCSNDRLLASCCVRDGSCTVLSSLCRVTQRAQKL